ncbi:MAG: FHA domain-containing protein, partial [Ktedonobacteraceae bacterium]|nr:FHA domain-containing protein [Ktedonobacteraceae bacterium]
WNQQQQGGSAQNWGSPSQPQQAGPGNQAQGWGQQQPADAWGQQSQQPADAWGQQSQQPADAWGQQSQQPVGGASLSNNSGGPASWQQQQGGFGQAGFDQGPNPFFGNTDNDKTVMRSSGPQLGGAVGFVRIEEGKEPGRVYEVRKDVLSIGRSRESDIFLEDLAVSRLHASILNMGNGNHALKDEGSANGTKVNGQLVNKYQTYPLQDGDRIQLGQTVMVFGRR